MSAAYIAAVTEHLPKAVIVFDHFHVIKLYNERLSDLRRELYHQINHQGQKRVIKGTRWLLLKNPENLNATRSEPDRLKQALKLNRPLAAAYYMKEDLRQAWKQPNKKTAKDFLID
jgi:transposase